MKVVVVDDEKNARQSIITILNNKYSYVEVVGECESVKHAVELINQTHPDLVFLDIDLTDGTGFDILNSLDKITFKIIFVTAHHEYAIKAIKFSALDYILKPISSVELCAAVDKISAESNTLESDIRLSNVLKAVKAENSEEEKKIVLKTSDSIHIVVVKHIVRCEADNNYTTFYLQNGERIVVSKGLKEYDELLTPYGFFRVHQSHLISVKDISRYDKRDGGFVVLTDNFKVPVSQRKKQSLLDIFEQYNN